MPGLRILTTDPAQDCIEACLIMEPRLHAYLKPGRNDNRPVEAHHRNWLTCTAQELQQRIRAWKGRS